MMFYRTKDVLEETNYTCKVEMDVDFGILPCKPRCLHPQTSKGEIGESHGLFAKQDHNPVLRQMRWV